MKESVKAILLNENNGKSSWQNSVSSFKKITKAFSLKLQSFTQYFPEDEMYSPDLETSSRKKIN